MKIAWIDHETHPDTRMGIEKMFKRDYDLDFSSARDWETFENKYGPVESYDGLLIHPGVNNQQEYIDRIKGLKIRVAIATSTTMDYLDSQVPVFSLLNLDLIAAFFIKIE